MKFEILPEDFDNAIKQPWSTRTCIVAQACIRIGVRVPPMGKELSAGGDTVAHLMYRAADEDNAVERVMRAFDKHFNHLNATGEEPALQALRASLPISVEL